MDKLVDGIAYYHVIGKKPIDVGYSASLKELHQTIGFLNLVLVIE